MMLSAKFRFPFSRTQSEILCPACASKLAPLPDDTTPADPDCRCTICGLTVDADVRFEGSDGIYKVFARHGNAYVYERTISVGGHPTRSAKLAELEESRHLYPIE